MARIAIIGSGISGLGAAALLHPAHDVTVYEKAQNIGGHARTLTIHHDGSDVDVDTGFIVYNERNYPYLTKMFRHYGVPVQKSNMTFGISIDNGRIEWGAQSPNSLFGQRSNLFNPSFWRFIFDILRFNAGAERAVARNPGLTLGDMIKKMRMGSWFAPYYILPMGGAIWSCPLDVMLGFPAKSFVDFFKAHGLLTVTQQPQWYTVTGGSRAYLQKLAAAFSGRIKTGCAVTKVERSNGSVRITDATGAVESFDHVILACHAPDTLRLLTDADDRERDFLGSFPYQKNTAVLHRDAAQMPVRRACWSSWVYLAESQQPRKDLTVTYWMNQLQSIKAAPLFVTLNPIKPIPDSLTYDVCEFEHPVYTLKAAAAQARAAEMQGHRNTWFCGAWLRNGFHEDGLASAVEVAKRLGVSVPWR